jgi:hypothetical protein
MKILFIFIPTFLLLLNSCKEENIVSPTSSIPELLPLKLGNYWIYRVGIKDSYKDTLFSFRDTLRVIEESEHGFLLKSRLKVILLDGYYKNGKDGLYMNDSLQFKYPGTVGEPCGQIGLGNVLDTSGGNPDGIIFKTDYKYSYLSAGDTITLNDCYYYFLNAFYQSENIKTTGYTIFKPGVGLVLRDWADIDETVNEFYNPFASLIDYHLE